MIVIVGSLMAGCGDDGDEGASPTSTTSGTPSGSVVVERNIAYATAPQGWLPAVLDVYAPADAEDLPLVIVLHGGKAKKDILDYPELARAIAGEGAVVVVGEPSDVMVNALNARGADATLLGSPTLPPPTRSLPRPTSA